MGQNETEGHNTVFISNEFRMLILSHRPSSVPLANLVSLSHRPISRAVPFCPTVPFCPAVPSCPAVTLPCFVSLSHCHIVSRRPILYHCSILPRTPLHIVGAHIRCRRQRRRVFRLARPAGAFVATDDGRTIGKANYSRNREPGEDQACSLCIVIGRSRDHSNTSTVSNQE